MLLGATAIVLAAVIAGIAIVALIGRAPTRPPASASAPPPSYPALRIPGAYLIIPRDRLMSLPMSGPAWQALVAVAGEDLGKPDLTDQDDKHGVKTLAVALVYARTGDTSYRDKAHAAIMSVIGTERVGADNSILALGRQLGSYVLAANLIGLSGPDDQRFRAWLSGIRTEELGGHGRWTQLVGTHQDSPNNWGAFAGASRIAADLYLGDTSDLQQAALVLRGFLGDRQAWSSWQPVGESASWACDPETYTPINPPCTLSGIDVDGAIVRDVSRGGDLGWPPGRDGILYTNEALQGLVVQAELIQAAGGDPWSWSDRALLRAANLLTRANGWNASPIDDHLPWIFNARYGLHLPTQPAEYGRLFGYTDWLDGP